MRVLLTSALLMSAGLAAALPVTPAAAQSAEPGTELPRFLTGDLTAILGTGPSGSGATAKPSR